MTLIKRSDKGQALTYEEMDGNFTHLGGDGTYQFPATDGTTNQVLVTNGEGQLEFRDQLDVDFSITDIQGSVYGQDSSLIVDSENNLLIGNLTGDVTGNVTGNGSLNIESSNPYDLTVNSGNDAYYYSDFGNTLIDAGEALTLSAVDGININSPVNTVIFGRGGFVGDVTGSVFADDSTILVDGVNATIPGYVSIASLKTEVAASADFAAFKARIAAL